MASIFVRRATIGSKQFASCSLLFQEWCQVTPNKRYCRPYSTSSGSSGSNDISVAYDRGLLAVSLNLPSKEERYRFTLRPQCDTLADFVRYIQEEDRGVDLVSAYNANGDRIAKQTPIHVLVKNNFTLQLNNRTYSAAAVSSDEAGVSGNEQSLDEVKNAVVRLYSALGIDDHQVQQERNLLTQLETLRGQMLPFEQKLQAMQAKAQKRTRFLTWLGLGLMGAQFGFLARLTWWEYSWDIMEPVTYFVTYGTALAMYAYYVVTRQDYNFPDVRDREFLLTLHREAKKSQFDVAEYNRLKESISRMEHDLNRLRDPLHLHLPVEHLLKQQAPPQTQ